MAARKTRRETALELNTAAIHLLRGLQPVDRQSGVTPARLSALSVLVFGGPSTLTSLARAEQVTPPTMARVVDALTDLGLATRTPHPDNARMVRVEATDHGRAVLLAARDRRARAIAAGLAALPPDQRADIARAAPALVALSTAIRLRSDATAAEGDPRRIGEAAVSPGRGGSGRSAGR